MPLDCWIFLYHCISDHEQNIFVYVFRNIYKKNMLYEYLVFFTLKKFMKKDGNTYMYM